MALETLVCHNQDHSDPFDRMMIHSLNEKIGAGLVLLQNNCL